MTSRIRAVFGQRCVQRNEIGPFESVEDNLITDEAPQISPGATASQSLLPPLLNDFDTTGPVPSPEEDYTPIWPQQTVEQVLSEPTLDPIQSSLAPEQSNSASVPDLFPLLSDEVIEPVRSSVLAQ